ncbi:TMEM175 family protein [Massilia horti]|uniref:DUF1211 domain-containing protein n=1 Tax=Massilia horti TaxID=2562153 RepID=A0A4Y9SKY4_9BURK|nr:TMEM175 family protein [Massilia horti]TFW27320.1 DUF1211 domain-containing protein [Massilia horti]
MGKNRLEAFSDGVIAILITILVLELKVPRGSDLAALAPLWPVFLSYVLSFVYIGIYWNNHHHLLHAVHGISGVVLWANLHLLFWLSLIPFVTGWMGENHFATDPVAAYGIILFMTAVAYNILEICLTAGLQENRKLAEAIGSDRKGKLSLVLYLVGIGLAFLLPWLGFATYVAVAIMWFIPDRRIENLVEHE